MNRWAANRGPLLFGHRGGCPRCPENTLVALRCGLEGGADVLEIDVRRCADGVFVLCHDEDGARISGVDRKIAHTPLAQLRRWSLTVAGCEAAPLATLEQVLGELPTALFNVDLKDHRPGGAESLVRLVHDRGASERVLLTSFSSSVLRRMRRAGYRGPTGLGRGEAIRAAFLPRRVAGVTAGQRLQIPLRYGAIDLTTEGFIGRMHRRGLAVDYWVVNDEAQARTLLSRGADGIVTDDVAAMGDRLSDVLSVAG